MEAYSGQADVSLFSDFGTGLCYPPSACCVNLRSIQCPLKSFPGQSCPATRPPPIPQLPEATLRHAAEPAPRRPGPTGLGTGRLLHVGPALPWDEATAVPSARASLPPTSLSIWSRDRLRASLLFSLPRSPAGPWPARWTPTHRQDSGPVVGEGMAQLGSKTTIPQPKANGTAHPGPTQLMQV